METQDASDQDGNDELKDLKESVEDENLNSKELPPAEKKRYHDLEPVETTEDVEKDSESQVLGCILHAFLSAKYNFFLVFVTRKSELVFQFVLLISKIQVFFLFTLLWSFLSICLDLYLNNHETNVALIDKILPESIQS